MDCIKESDNVQDNDINKLKGEPGGGESETEKLKGDPRGGESETEKLGTIKSDVEKLELNNCVMNNSDASISKEHCSENGTDKVEVCEKEGSELKNSEVSNHCDTVTLKVGCPDESKLENDETELENNESELENDESKLENDESKLENDESKLENNESELENDESKLENDESKLENDETVANKLESKPEDIAFLQIKSVVKNESDSLPTIADSEVNKPDSTTEQIAFQQVKSEDKENDIVEHVTDSVPTLTDSEVNKQECTNEEIASQQIISEGKDNDTEKIKAEVVSTTADAVKAENVSPIATPVLELRHMLEDIEEGELDYDEEDTDTAENVEDLPDLPEYEPNTTGKEEKGEIVDENGEEKEEGEIDDDDDEGGQVYICVDPVNDKWKKMSKAEKQLQDLEEGQIEDEEEVRKVSPKPPSPGRFIPRTLCKYYNNGLCRWGSTCRFLHPGVNDQGIPSDIQPTWNATAGNYVMHRPPGMYPNAFGKAPPPMECINVPVMPSPIVDLPLLSTVAHPEILAVSVNTAGMYHENIAVRKETAWEKGLRKAKEIKEAGARRRREDADFENKKLNMRITEGVYEEPNYEAEVSADKSYNEWNIDELAKSSDYADHRHRDERRSRYSDRFSRTPKESTLDRSSGRARLAELPPSHPIRREERQRLRERERREKTEKNVVEKEEDTKKDQNSPIKLSSKSISNKVNVTDPRVKSSFKQSQSVKAPLKAAEATEWHDPWMRSQHVPVSQQPKIDLPNKSGVEAISDSDSSSSDSDSDSDSSSSSKSSGSKSGSASSGPDTEKKSKGHSSMSAKGTDGPKTDRQQYQQQLSEKANSKDAKSAEKNEPLSYGEWKRLQTMQKAQYHQQMANQYKSSLGGEKAPAKENTERHRDQGRFMKQSSKVEEERRIQTNNQRPLSTSLYGKSEQISKTAAKPSTPQKDVSMVNDDKFDSPKRKPQSDSDSGSDTDSGSDSDSSGSDSDTDDSNSDSGSDTAMPTAPANTAAGNKTAANIKFGQMDAFVKKVALAEKAKPTELTMGAIAGKRPARKDELLKELKAVEDAIARKRAKID